MRTLTLPEAAEFLKCHPEWLRSQAKLGLIPGAKPGKSWVFIEEDLAAYVRAQYPVAVEVLQEKPKEQSPCHSINEKTALITGSKSPSQVSLQCRKALGL
jgi:hypothetical protein